MIRVLLPYHLSQLAQTDRNITLHIEGIDKPVTLRIVLDTLEEEYPMLRGTIRDQVTKERRAFLRFFACGQDLSHDSPDTPLPAEVVSGEEKFRIVGAMAGG